MWRKLIHQKSKHKLYLSFSTHLKKVANFVLVPEVTILLTKRSEDKNYKTIKVFLKSDGLITLVVNVKNSHKPNN